MKKWLSLSLVFMVTLYMDAHQLQTSPMKETFEWFGNKTINQINNEGQYYTELKEGDKVVLQYSKSYPQDDNIADDEMYESLLFEVDANWKNFVFRNKINLSKATYNLGCFCAERGYYQVQNGDGFIRGKKLSNGNYEIEASLTVTIKNNAKRKLKFKGIFKPVYAR